MGHANLDIQEILQCEVCHRRVSDAAVDAACQAVVAWGADEVETESVVGCESAADRRSAGCRLFARLSLAGLTLGDYCFLATMICLARLTSEIAPAWETRLVMHDVKPVAAWPALELWVLRA